MDAYVSPGTKQVMLTLGGDCADFAERLVVTASDAQRSGRIS